MVAGAPRQDYAARDREPRTMLVAVGPGGCPAPGSPRTHAAAAIAWARWARTAIDRILIYTSAPCACAARPQPWPRPRACARVPGHPRVRLDPHRQQHGLPRRGRESGNPWYHGETETVPPQVEANGASNGKNVYFYFADPRKSFISKKGDSLLLVTMAAGTVLAALVGLAVRGNQPDVAFPHYLPPLECSAGCGPWPNSSAFKVSDA